MERDNTNFCLSGKSKPFSNKLRDAATEKKSKDILSKLKPSSGKKDADPSKERPRTAVRQMPAPRARPRPSSATLTKSGHTATAKSRQTYKQCLTVFGLFGSLFLRGGLLIFQKHVTLHQIHILHVNFKENKFPVDRLITGV